MNRALPLPSDDRFVVAARCIEEAMATQVTPQVLNLIDRHPEHLEALANNLAPVAARRSQGQIQRDLTVHRFRTGSVGLA